MFFVLSKVLWIVTDPANLLLGLSALGLLAGLLGRRWGYRLALGGIGLLLILGFSPAGAVLLRPLEDRFPQPTLAGVSPTGIIVLGGPIDQVIGAARGQVTIGDAATRLTAGAALARRFPAAELIYTGGSNALIAEVGAEAEDARRLWIDLGVDPARIAIEDRSRNTDENARFTRDLLKPAPGQIFVLVTSAYHMPRSVGLFRAAGVPIVAYPVDYRTTGLWIDLMPHIDAVAGLRQFDVAIREWIGLLAYWLSGRIAEPFPMPTSSSLPVSAGTSSTAAASASE